MGSSVPLKQHYEYLDLDSIPHLAEAVSESFREYGVSHLIPRLSWEAGKIAFTTTGNPILIGIEPMEWMAIRVGNSEWMYPQIKPGQYQLNLKFLSTSLPVSYRMISLILDGSRSELSRYLGGFGHEGKIQ